MSASNHFYTLNFVHPAIATLPMILMASLVKEHDVDQDGVPQNGLFVYEFEDQCCQLPKLFKEMQY